MLHDNNEELIIMEYIFKEDRVEASLNYGTLTISRDEAIGYRPYELLVSSIAGCSGSVFKQIFEKQRIDVKEFKITTEIERNKDEANRVEKIILTFHLKGNDLNEDKLRKNLIISQKHCSMVQSVKDSITIEENLNIENL